MKARRWRAEEKGRLARPMRGQDQIGLMRWLPGLYALRHDELSWLPRDIMAGLVLSVLLVPVGVAYAVAAGLSGLSGLYATIAGLLAYAVFGPSRILVLGPDSSLSARLLAVVVPQCKAIPTGQRRPISNKIRTIIRTIPMPPTGR